MPGHAKAMPRLETDGATATLVVGGEPFIMLAGEVHNSSSSSLEYMDAHVWPRLAELGLNTVLAPVYWELVEPHEGRFDFGLVDGLIAGARERGMRLVPLWFGTWKNAQSTYAPEWVKTDTERFPRAEVEPGKRTGAVSSTCEAVRDADARAFAAFMARVREVDPDRTVIAVQVENECGLLGAPRDRSPAAEAAFAAEVPAELLRYLAANAAGLRPELGRAWREAGSREAGPWADVFGAMADEVFMAWHVARHVEAVAAAGKAEHRLPMFANAWLVQRDGQPPGEYPSGGPVSRVMDVWKAAAPSVDALAPDTYLEDFAGVCADYARADNPLFVPEARRDVEAAANAFHCIGAHDCLCFSPFGIEGISRESGDVLAASYAVLRGMMPLVAKHRGTGRMTGFLDRRRGAPGEALEEETCEVELGGYALRVRFPARDGGDPPGGGLAIALADNEYVVAGLGLRVEFLSRGGAAGKVDFLSLDEGVYRGGEWVPGRRLNGDEYHLAIGREPGVRRARVYTYE